VAAVTYKDHQPAAAAAVARERRRRRGGALMRPWGDVDRKSMLGCSIARCNRVPPASKHANLS